MERSREDGLPPIHPGEIIKRDILPSVGVSVTATARALVSVILAGRKPLSAVICLTVARLFGGSPELWMDLQATFDLKKSMQSKKVMEGIADRSAERNRRSARVSRNLSCKVRL
jgi:antitoxin HigA-1